MKILAEKLEDSLSVKIGDDREASYTCNSFSVKKYDKDNNITNFIMFDKEEFKTFILWGVQMLEEVK